MRALAGKLRHAVGDVLQDARAAEDVTFGEAYALGAAMCRQREGHTTGSSRRLLHFLVAEDALGRGNAGRSRGDGEGHLER